MSVCWLDLSEAAAMDARSAANCGDAAALLEAARRGEDVSGGGGGGGWTALMYACGRQSSAAVEALLRLGADPDVRGGPLGQTALMQACKVGDAEAVRRLLEAGADPTPADGEGRTALMLAASWGQTRAAALLLPPPPADLPALLGALGVGRYAGTLRERGVDLAAFLRMSEEELREAGVTLVGPRKKMALTIARWRRDQPDSV